ncbi:homeobox domain protein [Onchocerca flexuosa]|uniref:Homeobox domain protein n=1 Tax=Onchocerca flexuosa TaxID=387005 RepID=A0A238BNG7_9BILA|nr:homeobox domain protein [Onchocerca flexuosa]
MVYSDYQRLELEKEFRTSQFINSERKSQLSSELQLTERQIKIWFQNSENIIEPTKYSTDQDSEELLHVSLSKFVLGDNITVPFPHSHLIKREKS